MTAERRLVCALLVLAAACYVVAPVLQAAALPVVRAGFGLSDGQVGTMRIGGLLTTILALFAAGRAGDLWGRRPVMLAGLALLGAGCVIEVFVFGPWSYVIGHTLANLGVSAMFVTCLATVVARSGAGRMTRTVAGWLLAMSVAFALAVNLVPRLPSLPQLRLIAAATAVLTAGMLLLARRSFPETAARGAAARLDALFVSGSLGVALALAAALLLAPLRGWTDPAVCTLLALVAAGALLLWWRTHQHAGRPGGPTSLPVRTSAFALSVGVALGFTQVVLVAAVPTMLAAAGVGAGPGLLVLSCFGMGGALACLIARRRRISPLTGGSLGLPLAAVGLALLAFLPGGPVGAVTIGALVTALVGLGMLLALIPQMSGFLAALPRSRLGASSALHPTSLLLGAAAAQALPYTSVLSTGLTPDQGVELVWIGTGVAAATGLFIGRPVVVLAVAAASGAQYLLVRGLSTQHHADQPVAIVAALVVGLLAGLLAWSRRQQADHLARVRATATTLQQAVLHPIPARLGGLRLAGLYEPATAHTGVGGDFFDALHTPFGTRILIGDVRGKGLQAVQTVTDLLGCFRSQAHETPELGELVARLDRQMARAAASRADAELFATALVLEHRGGDVLHVINCGHLPPVRVSAAGTEEAVLDTLLPLGFGTLGEDCPPRASRFDLPHGDTLVLHTDGLSEARNSSGEFYPLAERVAAAPAVTPESLLRHLEEEVRAWTHHLADDIAVITLTRSGD